MKTARRTRRGMVSIWTMLVFIGLVALVCFAHNAARSVSAATEAQVAADNAAMTFATTYARGLNKIETLNQELSLIMGARAVAEALPRALRDCRTTAVALAAATSWWGGWVIYGPYLEALNVLIPTADGLRAVVVGAAQVRLPVLAQQAYRMAKGTPALATQTARASIAETGITVTFVPLDPEGDLELPVQPRPLGALCSWVKDGSPQGADSRQRRVFSALWGWREDEGTAEHIAKGWSLPELFNIALAPVGGPFHWSHRLKEAVRDECDRTEPGPYLFPSTSNPVEKAAQRTQFLALTLAPRPLLLDVIAPRSGERTFERTETTALLSTATVELANDVSIGCASSASWAPQLVFEPDATLAAVARVGDLGLSEAMSTTITNRFRHHARVAVGRGFSASH